MSKIVEPSLYEETLKLINDGRKGLNRGLPVAFSRLVDYVPGVQRGTYYLVGAETGVGKTTFVDEMFIYVPFEYLKAQGQHNKLRIVYYSLEIEKRLKIAKAMSRKLFLDHKKVIPVNTILSRGRQKLEDTTYELIEKMEEYFTDLGKILEVHDRPENPTGIYHRMLEVMEEEGKFIQVDSWTRKYIPNDPEKYVILIIDHVALLRLERGFDTKRNIDKMSEYLVWLRNQCNIIPVVISQFNRDLGQATRNKVQRIEPQLNDFKDSGNTQQDANIVLTLFSPSRYELPRFRGYDIVRLGDNFRALSVLKNRDGVPDLIVGLGYKGAAGHFYELPISKDMTEAAYKSIGV